MVTAIALQVRALHLSTRNTGSQHANLASLVAGGNLYVADTGTNRVRKVCTNAIITTIARNGCWPPAQ